MTAAPHLRLIEYGECHCGCGGKTAISKLSRRGVKAGDPVRFIRGHRARVGLPPEYAEEDRGYATPCWVWQRSTNVHDYGWKYADGRLQTAHRVYYERQHGPIDDGMELDHLCRVRRCVNPAHLEPVTHAENMRRGAMTKLSLEERAAIAASSAPVRVLAVRYGVSQPTIWRWRKEGR